MSDHAPIPRDVLGCIVAGYEKGGTTLVKDLLRTTGQMRSAFEGGLLFAEQPADGVPEPYAGQLLQSWELPGDFFDRYRACASFAEGYRLLRELSFIRRKELPLIDKTPRYMACLADVLRRAPGTPVVVVLRDPLQVAGSWVRLGNSVADAAEAIRVSTAGLVAAPEEALAAVYVIQLADVVADPAGVCVRLQAWLGREHVPYDATHQLGTSPPGAPPPLGVDAARVEVGRHVSPEEVTRLEAELTALVPWAGLVATVPSGPLIDKLPDARSLWAAVVADEAARRASSGGDPTPETTV
ncbi:MAG: sulfotransferase [Pirellulales bacterium]